MHPAYLEDGERQRRITDPSRRRRRDSAAIEGKKASPEVDLEERRTRVKRTVFYWQVGVCLLPQLFFILKTTKLTLSPSILSSS